MFHCEIDKNGFCFHATENPLPNRNNVIVCETNNVGKYYVDGEWVEYEPEPVEPELTETEEAILNTAINTEYLVCLAELGL